MNKTLIKGFAWILIVAAIIAVFFLVPGTITSNVILETMQHPALEDLQIYSEERISPTLEIAISPKQPEITPGLTYEYIQIKPIAEEFNYAEISFKVENSWIYVYRLEKQEVVLYLFNGTWKELPTTLEKEDEEFTHYKAKAYNIGLFAIAKATQEPQRSVQKEKAPIIPLTHILILVITVLSIILIIQLLSLIKRKSKFYLILLAFSIMVLGLVVQQQVTRDVLLYGLLPISIIAIIASFILTIILDKLRKHGVYSYVKGIVIALLGLSIFITSTTATFTKEMLAYAVLPLILLSMVAVPVSILTYKIDYKLRNNAIYSNIRNIILSLIPIYIFARILSLQPVTSSTFYFIVLPVTLPTIVALFVKYVKDEFKNNKPIVKNLTSEPPKFESLLRENKTGSVSTGIKIRDTGYYI